MTKNVSGLDKAPTPRRKSYAQSGTSSFIRTIPSALEFHQYLLTLHSAGARGL